jgi:hypothetical protein
VENGSSQDYDLASTVLYVPSSIWRAHTTVGIANLRMKEQL